MQQRCTPDQSGGRRVRFRITGDKNMPFQQNIARRRLGVLVMVATSNAIEDLLPVVPNAIAALSTIQAGQVVRVDGLWRG